MHRKHDLNNERQNKEINIWKAKQDFFLTHYKIK
jgi:hypothetical protein